MCYNITFLDAAIKVSDASRNLKCILHSIIGQMIDNECLTISVTSIPRGFVVKNPMPRFLPAFFDNSTSIESASRGSARKIVIFAYNKSNNCTHHFPHQKFKSFHSLLIALALRHAERVRSTTPASFSARLCQGFDRTLAIACLYQQYFQV